MTRNPTQFKSTVPRSLVICPEKEALVDEIVRRCEEAEKVPKDGGAAEVWKEHNLRRDWGDGPCRRKKKKRKKPHARKQKPRLGGRSSLGK